MRHLRTEATSSAPTFLLSSEQSGTTGNPSPNNVVDAVYAYVQAIRALGKTRVTAADIASALNIPHKNAVRAMQDLQNRGIDQIR